VAGWIRELRPPSQAYLASNVTEASLRKETNAVISLLVDVQADLDAIRGGQATYRQHQLGDDQFVLPIGRVYGIERPPGLRPALYPVSGPGIHVLTRVQMKVLGLYNRLGDTPLAAAAVERAVGAEDADREVPLRLSRAARVPRP
jgi:hypothetical protein